MNISFFEGTEPISAVREKVWNHSFLSHRGIADGPQTTRLDETLVVWCGEYGRTPTVEGDPVRSGRDHNPAGYTAWKNAETPNTSQFGDLLSCIWVGTIP
jgi:hypothetical protein